MTLCTFGPSLGVVLGFRVVGLGLVFRFRFRVSGDLVELWAALVTRESLDYRERESLYYLERVALLCR